MKRNPIQTYALTVCFVSLFSGSISLAVGIYDVIQISFPEGTNTSRAAQLGVMRRQQELFNSQSQADSTTNTDSPTNNLSNFVISSGSIVEPNSGYYVNQATQSLVFSAIVLVICTGIFFFHWGLAKRSDNEESV